jgi:hypothetical protein
VEQNISASHGSGEKIVHHHGIKIFAKGASVYKAGGERGYRPA